MSLAVYNKKRDFKKTAEPSGKKAGSNKSRFVVQRHDASHLHYDFRLELDGVLKSWAVPKGPSLNPSQKRLAVMVEDHPVSYINFHGTIPKGNYGAGEVEVWDKGNYEPINGKHEAISEKQALQSLKKGELKFNLKGDKLNGEFVLVRLQNDQKNWLLIKHKDEHSVNRIYNAEEIDKGSETPKTIASIRHGKAKKLSSFTHPMLASVAKSPFDDDEWIFEIKWDGYRAVSETGEDDIRFYSRNGVDFSGRFPVIFQALKKIKHKAVLDGEIVLLNGKNLPDFQKLQHYETNLDYPIVYYVFDILELEGKDMRSLPVVDRKKILKKVLGRNKTIRYCDHVDTNGILFLAIAKEKGLEGIIAKKKESTYSEGRRSKEWLKIKNVQSTEVLIAGYTAPKGGRTQFGSLVLASKKGKGWEYRGHVGTGFDTDMLKTLKKAMKSLEQEESPFKTKVPLNGDVTWIMPKLVADIAYTEVTRDKVFRHPVFLRLRDDKPVNEVNEEIVEDMKEVKESDEIKAGKFNVPVSNRQKIFWPDEGYTKGDLLNYYDKISDYILPHLKYRPLSLKRNPNGIRDEGFYHKDAGEKAPSYVKVFPVQSESSNKTIDYIVCNNKATLLYVANLGCIEINPWNSTTAKPRNPTWIVIDIDPSRKNTFTEVVDVALAVKEVLDKAKVTGYCKTSGSSGLHVYIPLKNKYDYDIARDFAHVIASFAQELLPETTTLERSLKKRGDRIYIDYLQNRPGQTLASVYSLRPVPGANASTPLDWKEVTHKLHPSQFTIENLPARLEKKGDIFNEILTASTNIPAALKLLNV